MRVVGVEGTSCSADSLESSFVSLSFAGTFRRDIVKGAAKEISSTNSVQVQNINQDIW